MYVTLFGYALRFVFAACQAVSCKRIISTFIKYPHFHVQHVNTKTRFSECIVMCAMWNWFFVVMMLQSKREVFLSL